MRGTQRTPQGSMLQGAQLSAGGAGVGKGPPTPALQRSVERGMRRPHWSLRGGGSSGSCCARMPFSCQRPQSGEPAACLISTSPSTAICLAILSLLLGLLLRAGCWGPGLGLDCLSLLLGHGAAVECWGPGLGFELAAGAAVKCWPQRAGAQV